MLYQWRPTSAGVGETRVSPVNQAAGQHRIFSTAQIVKFIQQPSTTNPYDPMKPCLYHFIAENLMSRTWKPIKPWCIIQKCSAASQSSNNVLSAKRRYSLMFLSFYHLIFFKDYSDKIGRLFSVAFKHNTPVQELRVSKTKNITSSNPRLFDAWSTGHLGRTWPWLVSRRVGFFQQDWLGPFPRARNIPRRLTRWMCPGDDHSLWPPLPQLVAGTGFIFPWIVGPTHAYTNSHARTHTHTYNL